MTNTELEPYRRQLRARQNRKLDEAHVTDKALGRSGAAAGASPPHVPLHIPDPGANSFERQFMKEIAAALERIEQGTFGCCEECDKTIPVSRLEVLPYTRFCVECAWKLQGRASK